MDRQTAEYVLEALLQDAENLALHKASADYVAGYYAGKSAALRTALACLRPGTDAPPDDGGGRVKATNRPGPGPVVLDDDSDL